MFFSSGVSGIAGIGLATKTAILKAVLKETMVHIITNVADTAVNIGAEELSKILIEEIANTHFERYFEDWIKQNSTHKNKAQSIESRIKSLYDKYGTSCRANIEACFQQALGDLISGGVGNKIFSQVAKIVNGVIGGLSMAARSLEKGSSKAKVIATIIKVASKTVKIAEFVKNFGQLCTLCNDFYDHLEAKLVSLERDLDNKVKNGTLKVDTDKLSEEKLRVSYSDETFKLMQNVDKKMHEAFKEKIRQGKI